MLFPFHYAFEARFEKRGDARGFSLIEMMTIVLIVSALSLSVFALHQHGMRRFAVQAEANALASSLERAKTFAQTHSTECRIVFSEVNEIYSVEYFDREPSKRSWRFLDNVSSVPIALRTGVEFGFPPTSDSPNYGPTVSPTVSATPNSSTVQFNSRGFPIDPGTGAPMALRAENAIYLTNGREYFAVTVDALGRVRVWVYEATRWAILSR